LKRRPEFQMTLLQKQLRYEAEAEKNHRLIICDRGLPDIMVYSKYYGHSFNWEELLEGHLSYDLIFLCSIEGIDASHSFSPTALRKRRILQDYYFQVFEKRGLFFEILSGELEARFSRIQEFIRQWVSVEGQRRNVEIEK